jgi:hypothetical protein
MPSLTAKDRVSLCLFTYEDGRRCRTPLISNHPHFCFYHAQKESQSQSTEKLAKEIAYFFSGDHLSANDLNTALGRLIPAVIRGEIKPRVARTVAYMLQTLMQSTRLAQHEYINAFSTDGWRQAISTSVNANHDYLFPPDPEADPDPEDEPENESEDDFDAPEPQQSTQVPTQSPVPPAPATPPATRPSPVDTQAVLNVARSIFPRVQTPALPNRPHPRPPQPHNPPNPTTPRHPLHHLHNPNAPPQTATPTKSASTTPTASSSTENPGNLRRQARFVHPETQGKSTLTATSATPGFRSTQNNISPFSATLTKNRGEGIGNNLQLLAACSGYFAAGATTANPSACITASCNAGRTSAIL